MHKSSFNKMGSFSRWPEGYDETTVFVVGVRLHDGNIVPGAIQAGSLRDLSGNIIADIEPNYVVGNIACTDLAALDTDSNVELWAILRKAGPVELTEDQIWAAFVEYENGRNPQRPFTETQQQFKTRDPIGYDECLAMMERSLYRALGYL